MRHAILVFDAEDTLQTCRSSIPADLQTHLIDTYKRETDKSYVTELTRVRAKRHQILQWCSDAQWVMAGQARGKHGSGENLAILVN